MPSSGSQEGQPQQPPLKNVVVVGAAAAGALVAKELAARLPATHRVVLIEAADHAYWQVGGLRAAVQPGFEDQVVRPLQQETFWPPQKDGSPSRHVLRTLTTVKTLGERFVETEGGERIEFEYAVVATGASYASPGRAASRRLDETLESLRSTQQQLARASHVVVVGGGPVGVEFAGELADAHAREKRSGGGAAERRRRRITLVSRGDRLVGPGWSASLHAKLAAQMRRAGVELLLDDEIVVADPSSPLATGPLAEPRELATKSGKALSGVDYVFVAFGGKPNSALVAALDAGAVDAKSGSVKVDPSTLGVRGAGGRLYAVGDATDAPGGKLFMQLKYQAPTVAANIVERIRRGGDGGADDEGSKVVAAKFKPLTGVMSVPFGARGGATQLMWITLGEWVTTLVKASHLYLFQFRALYPAAAAAPAK